MTLLSTDNGFVNSIMMNVGLIKDPIGFMAEPKYFWGITVISSLLKELGWGAILYIAAIAGISQDLYEAAMIDSRPFKRYGRFTIPLR